MNTPITRTPLARTMIALLSTATLAAALALAPPADATSQDISLSTEQGRAGTVRLGQRAAAAGEVVRGSDGVYRSRDGALTCLVDDGLIVEIQVTSPRYFSERRLRVGTTTLVEAIKAHGRPASSVRDPGSGTLVVTWDGLRAHFPWSPDAKRRANARLSRIDLIPKRYAK
jgi:hypothetical protein